jgi:hypothetical protein
MRGGESFLRYYNKKGKEIVKRNKIAAAAPNAQVVSFSTRCERKKDEKRKKSCLVFVFHHHSHLSAKPAKWLKKKLTKGTVATQHVFVVQKIRCLERRNLRESLTNNLQDHETKGNLNSAQGSAGEPMLWGVHFLMAAKGGTWGSNKRCCI